VEWSPLFNKPGSQEIEGEDAAKRKSVIGKAFISFSVSRNMRKLFYSPFNDKDNLKVLNGVRFLSFLLVILGHAYFNALLVPTSNPGQIPDIVYPLWFQLLLAGFFAVDVFFYLSAFLGTYLMIDKFSKSRMNIPLIYFHRFYRLAPNVFLLIVFAMTFFPYFGSGPIWHDQSEIWIKDCYTKFWAFVIFINSVYPGNNVACVGWLWYLSHDMIFFLTLPFQVMIYLRNRLAGYSFALFMLFTNIVIVFALTVSKGLGSSVLSDPNLGEYVYFKPWARFGAYQVGVLLGMLYSEYAKGEKVDGDKSLIGFKVYKSVQISAALRWILYTVGVGLILFILFIVTPDNRNILKEPHYPLSFSAIYNPLCRPLYVFGVGLILMGPLVGKGSLIQFLLGSRFYAPWAKISFYGYLVHLFVFTFYFGQMRSSLYLNHKTIMWAYFGVIFMSLVVATLMSVTFEAPLMQLEKLVLFPPKEKKEIKSKSLKINESTYGGSADGSDEDTESDIIRQNKSKF
jgi:peptidoglycan/LPS O-acetylase OafA/YrhL